MTLGASLYPVATPPLDESDQHIVLHGVPWSLYVMLRDSLDGPGLRMTFLEGILEIMRPSRRHEICKKQIARLLELFCLERDIPLFGYGSTTFRKEERQRGLEPDECYCRGEDRDTPDIAIEVVTTRGAIDKLEVYKGLGVREVWVFADGVFSLFALRSDEYQPIPASELLPELDLPQLAAHVMREDQPAALLAYREALRR